jgi:hypothetical protein
VSLHRGATHSNATTSVALVTLRDLRQELGRIEPAEGLLGDEQRRPDSGRRVRDHRPRLPPVVLGRSWTMDGRINYFGDADAYWSDDSAVVFAGVSDAT